ncbi:MAG TPA: hypothetical protein VGJ09_05340, partial [Bryobacteraceae bacterium]
MIARSVFIFSVLASIAIGAPAIGIVTASGHFSVEGSQVWGNATLFDGATVETGPASSELALRDGVKLQLGADSRARIWQNRLVLEKGAAQLAAPGSFQVSVLNHANLIRAPFRGNAAYQGAQGPVVHAGCMVYKDGRFLLQDQATQEVIELSGPDLAANVGNRVEARGAASTVRPTVTPATTVMNVAAIAPQSQGGCLSVAAALNARTDVPVTGPGAPANAGGNAPAQSPAPAVAHKGLSTGAKIGIAAAVGGGGAGAALALGGSKKSTS